MIKSLSQYDHTHMIICVPLRLPLHLLFDIHFGPYCHCWMYLGSTWVLIIEWGYSHIEMTLNAHPLSRQVCPLVFMSLSLPTCPVYIRCSIKSSLVKEPKP